MLVNQEQLIRIRPDCRIEIQELAAKPWSLGHKVKFSAAESIKKMNETIRAKRHPSLQPLSRDHGMGLLCAQHGHKAVRASEHDRLRLAEQMRTASRDVILSYLEDEQRVLSPVITNEALRAEFQHHQNNVRKFIDELEQLEPAVDPGLSLMASLAGALENYVRWEENSLFSALEQTLDATDLTMLSGLTKARDKPRPLGLGRIARRTKSAKNNLQDYYFLVWCYQSLPFTARIDSTAGGAHNDPEQEYRE